MVKAHAKLNLFLDVKEKREDNFHNVVFVNTELVLHDEIEIEEHNKGISIECNNKKVPINKDNLCYKSVESLNIKNIKIKIKKKIPMGGLGGGSADAAVVLKALNKKYNLKFSREELIKKAEQISTDACFSIIGGTALVEGKGEKITQLPKIAKFFVLLIDPKIKIENKTKYMYEHIDTKNVFHPKVKKILNALEQKNKKQILASCVNIFEQVKIREYIPIKKLIFELKQKGFKAMLAGEGPLVVVLAEEKEKLKKLQKALKGRYFTILTETK